jgi:hypothetical protein
LVLKTRALTRGANTPEGVTPCRGPPDIVYEPPLARSTRFSSPHKAAASATLWQGPRAPTANGGYTGAAGERVGLLRASFRGIQ